MSSRPGRNRFKETDVVLLFGAVEKAGSRKNPKALLQLAPRMARSERHLLINKRSNPRTAETPASTETIHVNFSPIGACVRAAIFKRISGRVPVSAVPVADRRVHRCGEVSACRDPH